LPQQYSQIRTILSKKSDRTQPRKIIILSGDENWQKSSLKEILNGYESDALWICGENEAKELNNIDTISIKKYHSWLGKEKKVVIFDANKDIYPDCFAAISGIVVGGGFFFMLLDTKEKWDSIYSSAFGQRFINSIATTPEIITICQNNEFDEIFIPESTQQTPQYIPPPFLTVDQRNTVESIEKLVLSDNNAPIVLISDRGRGKSAALGFVAAKLLNHGVKRIALTAPRRGATDIVFKHCAEQLNALENTPGMIEVSDSSIQFYAPDYLLDNDLDIDVLLVDEAAAIPVPILAKFLDKFSQCVFATTVHGYEGTGRGFAVRFNKILNEKYPDWTQLQMVSPIRWPINDPLENWVFNLLCLDAEVVDVKEITYDNNRDLKHQLLDKELLVNDSKLLREIFALLVLAHYKTRPQDLKDMLDNDEISIYVTLVDNHIIAVALVIREGGFSESLSTSVYRGERRPQGNLLAQTLTYHCGIESAATHQYARIMRIAVHPDLQNKGIGTELLNFIVNNCKLAEIDAVGTSFGMNKGLLNFWKKSKFDVVRIGFTREQTSGEHAAIMLLPLTEQGDEVGSEAVTRFNRQLPFWFDDILRDIPSEIKGSFETEAVQVLELNQFDKDDLQSFSQYSRNYELCIAALNKLVTMNLDKIEKNVIPDNFRQVLKNKIIKKMHWKEIGILMELSGKNETRNLFYRAICYLLDGCSE